MYVCLRYGVLKGFQGCVFQYAKAKLNAKNATSFYLLGFLLFFRCTIIIYYDLDVFAKFHFSPFFFDFDN